MTNRALVLLLSNFKNNKLKLAGFPVRLDYNVMFIILVLIYVHIRSLINSKTIKAPL